MRKTGFHLIVLSVFLLSIPTAGYSAEEPTGTDHDAIAQKLVTQSANIQEGDLVLVLGGVEDFELLESIAVQVRKLGAFPLVAPSSDRMARRMYDDVAAKYDSQAPEFALKLTSLVDAVISVDFGEPGLLAHVPPERLATRSKAFQPVATLSLARNVRQVNLGNALYPTVALSKQFGISQEEMTRIFWDGVNVDYSKLQAKGEALKAHLTNGKEVYITNPNGTDLKVGIEGRPVFVSDGVISDEDMKKGGAACQVWLPAGDVFLAAVPGTAEGKVVVDRQFFQGEEIEGLTLTFKAGKLTSMTAKSGLEPLKKFYDAAGPGKDLFAFVNIGFNPAVRIVPGSRMVAWMPAGMITVGIGGNLWAGGENEVAYGMSNHLPGSTVSVDGKVLVENGTLKF